MKGAMSEMRRTGPAKSGRNAKAFRCGAEWVTISMLVLLIFFVGLPAAFSEPPADIRTETVIASGLRGGALVPAHGRGTPAHNREMLDAMQSWNAHDWATGIEKFRRIWQQSPDSPWAAEAELHEACYLKFTCQYDASEERFLSVLSKHPDNPGVRKKVFYYLPHLYATTGRLADALETQRMLGEYELTWQERQFMENQVRILSSTKKAQDDGRLCGVKALALAQAAMESGQPGQGLKDISYHDIFAKRPWALERSSHPDGYSVADLTRQGGGTARRISYEELRQLAKPGAPVIAYLDVPRPPKVYAALRRTEPANAPSLTGHFVVVERAEDGYLDALDPVRGRQRWDACMFQARWSGIAVVPGTPGQPGSGKGQPLESDLAETLRGGCCGSPPPDPCGGSCEGSDDPPDGPGSNCGGATASSASSSGCSSCGSPSYRFGLATANLILMDTPMWYPDANGPAMNIQLVHNRSNSGILSPTNTQSMINYYIFGNKWSFNYSSFVKVAPGGNIQVVMPDGLVLEYLPNFTPVNIRNRHTLSLEGAYYRLMLDGSRTSYYYSTNATTVTGQQVERIVDQSGQTITLQYNASGQLTNIIDAVGRNFRLSYNGAGQVTNVADMIGRSCSFDYSANSNLVSMTDMGGYTTTLQYDNHNWITNVVYPNTSVLRLTYETNGTQIAQHDSPNGGSYNGYEPPFRIRVINSLNQTNEYMYHAFYDTGPATVTDQSGNIWLYSHEPWDRWSDNKTPAIRCVGVNDRSYNSVTEGIAHQWTYREHADDNTFNLTWRSQNQGRRVEFEA
jgi:YD repeat-containing protein